MFKQIIPAAVLLIASAGSLTTEPAQARSPHTGDTAAYSARMAQERGGGSSTAAQIDRYTEAFIQIVEDNPRTFHDVDPARLRDPQAQILTTTREIRTCSGRGQLDAYTDIRKKESIYNLTSWLQMNSTLDRLHLAGHERLVLAGYERSNQYTISNRLYQLQLANLESLHGPAQSLCEFGRQVCAQANNLEDRIAQGLLVFSKGDMDPSLISIYDRSIENLVLAATTFKSIELSRTWLYLGNKQAALDRYTEKVHAAAEAQFRPLLLELQQAARSRQPANPCVKLN